MSVYMSSWHWILRDESGEALRETEQWEAKEEAEAWITSSWPGLVSEGAASVSLMEGDREEYTMSLAAE
jgi:hypothetical protein